MGSVAIGHVLVTGLVHAGHPAAERMRGVLGRITPARLERSLSRAFAGAESQDETVLLVRRIAVELTVDAARGNELSDLLGEAIGALVPRLALRPGEECVKFASPAAYLAAFLASLARGDAWRAWWFEGFADLRMLPVSAALRTVILRDPGRGLAVLLAMRDGDRGRVTAMLSATDARMVLGGFAGGVLVAELPARAWAACLAMAPATMGGAVMQRALARTLAVLAGDAGLSPPAVAAAAVAIETVLGRRDRAVVRAALLDGAHDEGLPRLVRTAPLAVRAALAAQLGGDARLVEGEAALFSPFAGLLILVPHVPVDDADGRLLLLVLAACAGRARAAAVLGDAGLRAVLGVEPRPPLAAWLAALDTADFEAAGLRRRHPGDGAWLVLPAELRAHRVACRAVVGLARAALAALAARLPGCDGASAGYLWREILSVPGRIEADGAGFRVVIDRPPLDVLLSISGLADRVLALPGGRVAVLERAG